MWYSASIIMYARFRDGVQNKYPVWENVILIEADDPEEAMRKAALRGREDAGDSEGTYVFEGRPATIMYGGIRKIVECEDIDDGPADGSEVSYSQMEVSTQEALEKLIRGEPVVLKYDE